MVSLVGRRVLVAVQQDHQADVAADAHRHVAAADERHRQRAAFHGGARVARQHQAVPPVQDDLGGRHLDVGAAGAVGHHGDAAKVGALTLAATRRGRRADEFAVHRHA